MSSIINNNPKFFPGHYNANNKLENLKTFANSPRDEKFFLETGDERIREVKNLIDKHFIITSGADDELAKIRQKLDNLKSIEQANNALKTEIKDGNSEYLEAILQKNSSNNNDQYLDNNVPTGFSTTDYYKIENGKVIEIGKLINIYEQHFFTNSTNKFSFLLNSNENTSMYSGIPLIVYKRKTPPPPKAIHNKTPVAAPAAEDPEKQDRESQGLAKRESRAVADRRVNKKSVNKKCINRYYTLLIN
jgi:hypothetical protein